MTPQPTVPCRHCGELTPMTGTRQCDRCWEVTARVRRAPTPVLLAILEAEGYAALRVTWRAAEAGA